MNRHLSRIIVMQTLYEHSFRPDSDIEEILNRNLNEYQNKADEIFVRGSVDGVIKNNHDIDKTISDAAPEWPLDQIASVDKATLQLAIYELNFTKEIPPRVVINEAVELAKQFGGESSSKFVNGVLGTVFNKLYKNDEHK